MADTLAVQGVRPWVERSDASGWPFVVLLPPVLLGIACAAWLWRRRGRAVVAPPVEPVRASSRERLQRWADSGEIDLAIDHLAALLPTGAAADQWRERVDEVRFDPAAVALRTELLHQGLQLL